MATLNGDEDIDGQKKLGTRFVLSVIAIMKPLDILLVIYPFEKAIFCLSICDDLGFYVT